MKSIEIQHLKKYFGEVKAVDDISFSVERGEFFAFLGENGAGKSTTISVLCGKYLPTEGNVLIEGQPVGAATKRSLGVVFQDSVLDKSLSVRENLACRAALYGLAGEKFERRLKELSALLSLDGIIKRPFGKLSGGQKRRADIARALLHSPRILILDEPTTGLDPKSRMQVWETVHMLRKIQHITVFLTTHYMEEAADADHVVIIDGGKIKADDTPLNLKNRYAFDAITLYHVREEALQNLSVPYERVGGGFRIRLKNTAEAARLISEHSDLFSDFEVTKGGMDEVFLAVTGRKGGSV